MKAYFYAWLPLLNIFFLNRLHIFRAVLGSWQKGAEGTEISPVLPAPTQITSPTIKTLQSGTLVKINKPTLAQHYHYATSFDHSYRILLKLTNSGHASQPHTDPRQPTGQVIWGILHGTHCPPRDRKIHFSVSPQWPRGQRKALWKDLPIIITATTIVQVYFHRTCIPPPTLAKDCSLSEVPKRCEKHLFS